ncbi:hypothetical protein ACEQPO_05225 [Bacillus sp. SL00103]
MLTIISIDAAYIFPQSLDFKWTHSGYQRKLYQDVGFIGAGVILRKSNDVISGLTTSAMIWESSRTWGCNRCRIL